MNIERHFIKTLSLQIRIVSVLIVLILSRAIFPQPVMATNEVLSAQLGLPVESRNSGFHQYDLTYRMDLPWHSSDRVFTDLRFTGGMLADDYDRGMVFSVGPTLGINMRKTRMVFLIGSSVTALGVSRFETRNLGGKLQFTSHVGVGVHITDHVGMMLGVQHMSNASLHKPNPGLNMFSIRLCRLL